MLIFTEFNVVLNNNDALPTLISIEPLITSFITALSMLIPTCCGIDSDTNVLSALINLGK
jgi:hypothetical protein